MNQSELASHLMATKAELDAFQNRLVDLLAVFAHCPADWLDEDMKHIADRAMATLRVLKQ